MFNGNSPMRQAMTLKDPECRRNLLILWTVEVPDCRASSMARARKNAERIDPEIKKKCLKKTA
jgi:hypothetical protein